MKATKSVQQKADELVGALRQARRELMDAVAVLPPSQANIRFLGTWSVTDLVAHLAGWDHTNLAAIRSILTGYLPDFYNRYDTGWRTYNAELVATYKEETLEGTIRAAEASFNSLIAALEGLPAEDITRDHDVRSPGGRRVTIAMLLAAESHDEKIHAGQLRTFLAKLSPTGK